MKKLLTIITLFVSSFFLFSSKEVKASEVTLDISFDLINDNFLEAKRLADEFLQNTSDYDGYIIAYKSVYNVHFFSSSVSSSATCNNYGSKLTCSFYKKNVYYLYSSSSGKLINSGSSSSFTDYDIDSNFNNILYSTIPFLYKGYSTDILYLNYGGVTKTILYEENISLVYDLYLELNSSEEEVPEELQNVTNFYTMVLEKIEYLAEQISSNYILLSIIVIFILIFLFLLIFRRFL